jgi:pimeloyl-ACP methyl ester carboxylesterase
MSTAATHSDRQSQPVRWENAGVHLVGDRWEGEPDSDIVLLLHGGGQTRHSWKHTAERLARGGRTALALDARGHGDSEWHPEQDYSIEGLTSDLVALIATLDRPPVLVGASMGGITSLSAEGEHPGSARGLVLVDIVATPEREGVHRITSFMKANPDGFASLEEAADAIAAYNPLRPRPRSVEGLRKNLRLHDNGRWYWHWDPAFMQIDNESQRNAEPAKLRAAAAKVKIPTLIVRGRQSDMVSDAGIQEMRELIPHAENVDVRAAGHMVAGDDNDVFTASLEGFLDRL